MVAGTVARLTGIVLNVVHNARARMSPFLNDVESTGTVASGEGWCTTAVGFGMKP